MGSPCLVTASFSNHSKQRQKKQLYHQHLCLQPLRKPVKLKEEHKQNRNCCANTYLQGVEGRFVYFRRAWLCIVTAFHNLLLQSCNTFRTGMVQPWILYDFGLQLSWPTGEFWELKSTSFHGCLPREKKPDWSLSLIAFADTCILSYHCLILKQRGEREENLDCSFRMEFKSRIWGLIEVERGRLWPSIRAQLHEGLGMKMGEMEGGEGRKGGERKREEEMEGGTEKERGERRKEGRKRKKEGRKERKRKREERRKEKAGEFWELMSTYRKVAKIDQHYTRG
ncbi:Genetic suppressor element 1, partial [Ophiophagus hannah]